MQLAIARRMPSTASLDRLAADNRFRRYGSMQPQAVRQADVTGQSYIEQARKARQMLREMTPAKALEVIEFRQGLNLFQALALAKREGMLIVPNDVHDRILMETTDQRYLEQNYPVWTGTLIIYEEPDVPFGNKVVFQGLTFIVPEQFQGKVNCALVIEHPDFELVDRELVASSRPTNPSGFVVHFSSPRKIGDLPKGQTELGNNRYELKVADENIHLIEQFPNIDGWYMLHAETGISHGRMVNESSDSRCLYRLNNSSYLGPVVRGYDYFFDDGRRDVGLYLRPSGGSGVALVPLAVAPKMSDSHD